MSHQQEQPSAFDITEPEPPDVPEAGSAGEALDLQDDALEVAEDSLEPE